MVYTFENTKGRRPVDTDKIAKCFAAGGQNYVHPATEEDRVKLIEYLESEGFSCVENQSYSRQDTIESRLPLVIELEQKKIYRMGNVTSAAAAAGTGIIMTDRDFYLLYSLCSLFESC